MYTIQLPAIDWFLYGNVYTGSCRTDPTTGCLHQTTFNYTVKVVRDQKTLSLLAVCYYTFPWNQSANMDEAFVGRFEVSDFGVEVCRNWIFSKFLMEYSLPPDRRESFCLRTKIGA